MCGPIFSQPEIDDVMKQAKKDSTDLEECILQLMSTRMWDMVTFLLDKTRESKVSLKGLVKKRTSDMKSHLETIINSFEKPADTQMYLLNSINPALKWAQSPDMLFMDIKYAHRFDSPGCLELTNRTIEVEKQRFGVEGDCSQSGERVKVRLDLQLYAEIDTEASFYSDSSAGRLTVNLKKLTPSIWPLPISGTTKPTNMLPWWEMKEKYAEEVTAFEGSMKTAS